jgi:CRP-like cAMP-binding protein
VHQNTDRKVAMLRQVRMFERCSPRELRAIASVVDPVRVPAGWVLVRQGDAARECYFVVSGTADAFADSQYIGTVGPGESIGETDLIERLPRMGTVLATTDMTVLCVPASRFDSMLEAAPSVAAALLVQLSGRLRSASTRFASPVASAVA